MACLKILLKILYVLRGAAGGGPGGYGFDVCSRFYSLLYTPDLRFLYGLYRCPPRPRAEFPHSRNNAGYLPAGSLAVIGSQTITLNLPRRGPAGKRLICGVQINIDLTILL